MRRTLITLSFLCLALGLALPGGSPCESLEEKICDELRDSDCEVWRDNEMPGFPSGRRRFRQCVNSQFGTSCDVTRQAVRASVDAPKDVPSQ